MKNWIAVASAEHVRFGRAEGFMQVCHGKCAPLRRIAPGDGIAYYSPTEIFRGKDRLQAFTAIGVVDRGEPYQVEMSAEFRPFRRNVFWRKALEAPISPLLERLTFTRANRNWGYQLRFGLFEVSADDLAMIAEAMAAESRSIGSGVSREAPLPTDLFNADICRPSSRRATRAEARTSLHPSR